uniref:SH3 domain-containing protein C23A1.17-like n=1 Tax=Styela clava TaxID=7725 RepID=UPI00193A1E91|nr:SH3 domain-containing protein C23A1.17-like [Styela clava]
MNSGSSPSLQDRIKALNLNKVPVKAPSNNKKVVSPIKANNSVAGESSFSKNAHNTHLAEKKSPQNPQLTPRKPSSTLKTSTPISPVETNSITKDVNKYVSTTVHTSTAKPKDNLLISNEPTYSSPVSHRSSLVCLTSDERINHPAETNISNTLANNRRSMPNLLSCVSESSLYSDVPNNRPVASPRKLNIPKSASETALYSDIPSNRPLVGKNTLKSKQENGVSETDGDDRAVIGPDEINSRWKRLRQTVKEPHLRTMVDMSFLLPSSPDDVITRTGDDVINQSRNTFKRSQSLGDDLLLATESKEWKRPSLPALLEKSDYPEIPDKAYSPTVPTVPPPDYGFSRESSFKSTHSSESRISENYSDVSEFSYDSGRPRNYSDVSVTFEEGNYMAFETLYDDTKDNLLPNERTLIIVKGDKEYTGKLTLETDTLQSPKITTDSPRSISSSSDDRSPGHDPRKEKGKKFKKFGKLTKAVKNKITSSGVTKSPSKLMTSSRNISSSKHLSPTSQRHMTHSAAMMTSPRKSQVKQEVLQTITKRPASMFPDIKKSTEDHEEGVYYDPTIENEEDEDQELGDIITIEVIHEDDNDDVIRFSDDVIENKPLTSQHRSQSLASLNMELTESFGNNRRFSDNIGGYNQSLSSTPPIPPPKHKSIRRKAERKLAESESHMTSSNGMTSLKGQVIKLRQKKQQYQQDRQDWPNGRPPSMPSQMPPAPPRPLSMPPDEPPQPVIGGQEGLFENEYAAPELKQHSRNNGPTNQRYDHIQDAEETATNPPPLLPRVPVRPMAPPASLKPIVPPRLEENLDFNDAIYHTVEDPVNTVPAPHESNQSKPDFSTIPDTSGSIYMDASHLKTSKPDRYRITASGNRMTDSTAASQTEEFNNPNNPISTAVKLSPLFPPQSSIKPLKPGKPKPSVKPVNGKKPMTLKPAAAAKPNFKERNVLENKLDSDSGKLSVGFKISGVNNSDTPDIPDTESPPIPSRDIINPVRPPPRPSKAKKFQNGSDTPKNNKIFPKNYEDTEISLNSPKIPVRSPAIAELGKLISMGSPLSPKHLKPAQKVIKSVETDTDASTELVIESAASPIDHASVTSSMTSQGNPVSAPMSSSASNKSNSPKSETTISIKSPTSKNQPRRPAKRPTTAPPPRPAGPPPPRPGKPTMQENKPVVTAEKAIPPSRPPPPSSDKIKAAEERRKLQSIQDNEEDEYNDSSIKHNIEEDNPYADIDDDAFDAARGNLKIQKDYMPPPTSRPKNVMKKAVQGISVISTMKGRLGRQKKNHVTKIAGKQIQPIVTEKGIYNEDTEEGVYAGIDDDYEFPPLNTT